LISHNRLPVSNLNVTTFLWIVVAIMLGGIAAFASPGFALLMLGIPPILILTTSTPIVLLVLLLVLAPLRTLIATEFPIPMPLDIGQILLLLVVFGWLLHSITYKRRLLHFQWNPIYIPIVGFILLSSFSMLEAASLAHWLSEYLKWIVVIGIIYLLAVVNSHNSIWEWLVFCLVVAALANAIVGIYIFFGGSGADHLLISNRFFRAFGTFGQPNPFGGFMGLVTPVALMATYGYGLRLLIRFWHSQKLSLASILPVLFYGIACLLLVSGLFASWSRGAWLGFVIALAAIAFALPQRLWQSFALLFSVVGLVLVLWFGGLLPDAVVARVVSSTEDFFAFEDMRGVDITSANYAVVERLAHWQAALNMAEAKPWLGVGLGNYEVVYDDYRLLNWREPLGHAHNYYLNILAEAGIIGFLMYVASWVGVLWLTWQARAHPDLLARSIAVGLLGSWTYFAVHSMLDNLFVNNLFMHIGVLFAILAILHRQVTISIRVSAWHNQ